MEGFKVITPGILSSFQDLGRKGYGRYGIPGSGAMDSFALRAANLLTGNEESAVCIEVTLQGLSMIALAPVSVAVTGADLQFTINSQHYAPWQNFKLNKGDVIAFQKRLSGVRSYLSVQGGFIAPMYLGSASVCMIGKMGSPLKKDDILRIGFPRNRLLPHMQLEACYPLQSRGGGPIRVIAGPQTSYFSINGLAAFLNSSFRVKPESNRMAYVLEGEKIAHIGMDNVLSQPITVGSIQVTGKGNLVVLMVDGQVTGGYVKIANVISADISCLSQTFPGESIRFVETDLGGAYLDLEKTETLLSKITKRLAEG